MPMHSDEALFKKMMPSFIGVDALYEYLRAQGASYVGMMRAFEVTVASTDVATAGTKALFTPASGESWKLRTLFLLGPFTNFHSGGDRLLDIKSSTVIYSRIPNATLESLAAARWGETALPFPTTAADGTTAFTSTNPLIAAYQGGTTDHSAGSLVLQGIVERTA